MKHITLTFNIDDNMGLRSVTYDYNDTSLPNDSNMLEMIAVALLKSVRDNKDTLIVQDLFNELGIDVSK